MTQRYEFVPGDSEVVVHAKAPLHTTTARARKVTGEFTASFDDDGRPTGELVGYAAVRLDAFGSGNLLLDVNTRRHLGAGRHPEVRFTIGAATAGRVEGTLDFAGQQRPIAADVAVEHDGDHVVISGTWTLVQTEFGVKPPRLAMLSVDDEVAVEFRLVATAARM